MKVVLDTNIFISAFGWPGNPRAIVRLALAQQIKLVLSMSILEEFKEAAREPELEFSEEEISDFIDAVLEVAELIAPLQKLDVIKADPSDNRILECALQARADFVVSGDHHLLDLKEFRGIKILTAKQFLDRVG